MRHDAQDLTECTLDEREELFRILTAFREVPLFGPLFFTSVLVAFVLVQLSSPAGHYGSATVFQFVMNIFSSLAHRTRMLTNISCLERTCTQPRW
jgi:hypothetical protein